MPKKYNLDVRIDKENSLLYANLSVPSLPAWQGFYKYDVEDVCNILREQGYYVKSKHVVSTTSLAVRTDDEPSTKGQWVFRLKTNKVEFKPGPKTEPKPEPTKLDTKTAPKKKSTPKTKRVKRNTQKQTTKEILEAYKKENN